MAELPFTSLLKQLPATVPFVGPEALERRFGRPFRLRLGANESAFGVSPKAQEAMQRALARISWYNDPENYELREALAATCGVPMARITVGAGIDDLLGLAVRAFVAPGTAVVTSLGAYPTFNYHVEGYGGRLHFVPYRNDHNDLEGLAEAAARTGAPLVFLANPDNPTGTWHTAAALQAFLAALPRHCMLVLDEAYCEFAPPEAILPLTVEDPRLIRMRTFSKAHGMAGARVGYALAAPEVVAAFDKIRLHFGVNRVAQAGALASLQDPGFVQGVVQAVAEGRRDYEALARAVGLATLPSATNFVSFDAGSARRAQAILEALLARGVFVRKPSVPPLDCCFRVTVGTPAERRLFAEVLRQVLAELEEGEGR
ncbi:MAG: histidinol-phosphate aminotransferase [Candidatus Tectimicrobiota bacterium]|nr:MAG: histidinol-phosphate aminotransferase [Candidatus Tectomicrobia bacterium]